MRTIQRTESISVDKVVSAVEDIAGGVLRERGRDLGIEDCDLGLFGHDGTMGGMRRVEIETIRLPEVYELAKGVSAELGRRLDVEFEPVLTIRDDILIFGGRPSPDLVMARFPA